MLLKFKTTDYNARFPPNDPITFATPPAFILAHPDALSLNLVKNEAPPIFPAITPIHPLSA